MTVTSAWLYLTQSSLIVLPAHGHDGLQRGPLLHLAGRERASDVAAEASQRRPRSRERVEKGELRTGWGSNPGPQRADFFATLPI